MRKYVIFAIAGFFLTSCEDVIDVDLNEAAPRLVIESNINVAVEDSSSVSSLIRLTTTAPFFDDAVPVVADASIEIIDENGAVFSFTYINEGYYHHDFVPKKNIQYTLRIIYNDEVYTGTTNLVPTAHLEYIKQRNDGGFLGDQIELKAYFQDIIDEENYYFFTAMSEKGIRRAVYSDAFYQGNEMFGSYSAEDLEPGDEVQFGLFGISEEYYNYMYILLQQTGGGGGPFETQPATVKGNIINETNPENFPLGYFQMSEISILNYVVE